MKAAALIMGVALLAGCATAPAGEEKPSRPFYYYHTNYPEHMDQDSDCHGCAYDEGRPSSERKKFYRKLRR